MSYCNTKLFDLHLSDEDKEKAIKLVSFDKETCKFSLNTALVKVQKLSKTTKFVPSLHKNNVELKVVLDWVYFDLDLMKFSSKHLETGQKHILKMIPTVASDQVVEKWKIEPKKYYKKLETYKKNKKERDRILARYPKLENQLIQWREEYRVERVKRLRAKREKIIQEQDYIPDRQKSINKRERRLRRAERRKKFEEDNSLRRKNMQTLLKRTKLDNLSDTDTDPENEHLSKWSELEWLPLEFSGYTKIVKGKGGKRTLNLID